MTDVHTIKAAIGAMDAERVDRTQPPSGNTLGSGKPRRAPRIGLWGNFGCGNIGNDATLAAIIALVRHRSPDAELVCICTAPERVAARFGLDVRPIYATRSASDGRVTKLGRRLRDHMLAFNGGRGLDCIIVPGTGPLCDYGERPIGFPYAMLQMTLWARARRIPIAFVAVGAGPIVHPMSRRILSMATRLATHRSFRDDDSRRLMASLGVDTSEDEVVPDLVFSTRTLPMTARDGGPRTVGIGVMQYFGHHNDEARGCDVYQRYVTEMTELVARLAARGDYVRLLIGEETDRRPVGEIIAALKTLPHVAPGRVIASDIATFDELLAEIGACDVIVASRFHNVIGGLLMRRPTLSLSYSHRHDLLMKALGVGAWCGNIEDVTAPSLLARIDELTVAGTAYRETIAPVLDQYRMTLDAHADGVMARVTAGVAHQP